jgi:hypothetical protein
MEEVPLLRNEMAPAVNMDEALFNFTLPYPEESIKKEKFCN